MRNLLRKNGMIFVSIDDFVRIDDNELHNLRTLMGEMFGEENFVALITVRQTPGKNAGPLLRQENEENVR